MGRRSSIDELPDEVRAAIVEALRAGHTYDEIVDRVRAMGEEVSRSSVGRYAKNFRELAARQRDLTAVAEAFGAEFGSSDDPQVKLLIQLATSAMTQTVLPIASGEDAELAPKDWANLARATKDIVSAAKTEADREAKIREEERKRLRQEAVEAAEVAGRASGASDATIQAVKEKLLGIGRS